MPTNADKNAVRKAYRKLAMQYHPDKNPDPSAKEKFISITEAYEILIGERKPKITFFNRPASKPKPKTQKEVREAERQERAEKSKERILREQKRRYEEFIRECEALERSPYRNFKIATWYGLYFLLLGFAFFLIAYPVIATLSTGDGGYLFFGLVISPMTIKIYYEAEKWKEEFKPYITKQYPKIKKYRSNRKYRRWEDL